MFKSEIRVIENNGKKYVVRYTATNLTQKNIDDLRKNFDEIIFDGVTFYITDEIKEAQFEDIIEKEEVKNE